MRLKGFAWSANPRCQLFIGGQLMFTRWPETAVVRLQVSTAVILTFGAFRVRYAFKWEIILALFLIRLMVGGPARCSGTRTC